MTTPDHTRWEGHAEGDHFLPAKPIENDDAGDSTEYLDHGKQGAD